MSNLQDIREMTVYTLADSADAPTSPASAESPGAAFLDGIRTDFLERFDYVIDQKSTPTADDIRRGAVEMREDIAHEIADSAVPIYTSQRWQTFADLAAWEEDTSELGDAEQGMTALAGVALYMIAQRLVIALAAELDEWADDMEANESDDDEGLVYDSAHATVAERDARIAELTAARPDVEIVVQMSDSGLFEVYIRTSEAEDTDTRD